ncbi:putative ABC transporter, periplasmic solute-binding protein [Candidatus Vecturithrix granuli]|uniref:Putative ABC transporter, periplasmic solute-binding protein n=1 Tax=Vecturithrix granuli TaxID=1499967 RepID=A0A081C7T9_VECG1|nr:putative ABC transporter, periplasmic solute-binding protein [Candidatus Vecturithrix granuli]
MKPVKNMLVLLFVFVTFCVSQVVFAQNLPAGPEFASEATMDDEGAAKPIAKSEKPIRIAVLGLENNPFWIPVKQGALDANEELKEFNGSVDWIVPGDQHTTEVFASAIESAIVQQYDAIATVAGDSGLVPYINKAVEAGIPVATFNVETAEPNKRLFFVGADLYKQGLAAGKIVADALNKQGKVAIITGFFAVEGHELRRKGFIEALKQEAPDIQIVGEVESNDKSDVAYTQTRDFMTANPDLAAIFVAAGGQFGAGNAVKDAGKTGQIKVVCYDFVDEVMRLIKEGVITGTISQNPYAQGHDPAIRLFNYLVSGTVPPAAKLLTKSELVTKDNLDQYWTESQ